MSVVNPDTRCLVQGLVTGCCRAVGCGYRGHRGLRGRVTRRARRQKPAYRNRAQPPAARWWLTHNTADGPMAVRVGGGGTYSVRSSGSCHDGPQDDGRVVRGSVGAVRGRELHPSFRRHQDHAPHRLGNEVEDGRADPDKRALEGIQAPAPRGKASGGCAADRLQQERRRVVRIPAQGEVDKRARPPAVSWNLPRRGARPFFRGGGVDGERNGRAAEPGSAVAPGAVLVKRLSPAAERSPPPCRGLRLNFPAGFVSGLHIYRDGQHRDETEHYFRCPAPHGWHRSPLNGAPVLATRGAHRRRFQRSVDRHHPRSRR